jgi:hypothetical protein
MSLCAIAAVVLAGQAKPSSNLNAGVLQSRILQAYQSGQASFVLGAGTYRLTGSQGSFFLQFQNLHDFTISGAGATVILDNPMAGFLQFVGCQRVSLTGFTVVHDPVPFTQAVVTDFDPNFNWIDIQVMPGYPDWTHDPQLLPQQCTGDLFVSQTRQWKPQSYDIYSQSVTALGGRKFRVNYAYNTPEPVKVGDYFFSRGNVSDDLELDGCQQMHVQGVTFESSTGFCVHESDGNGNNSYNYTLTYGPPPTGATEKPLVSSNADAFHSNATRQGPTLNGCLFEGMPDDGVNIHGNFAAVAGCRGKVMVVDTLWGDFPVVPGDPLEFYNAAGVPLGVAAKVVYAAPLSSYTPPQPLTLPYFSSSAQYWEVTLDRPISLAEDTLVAMPYAQGNNSTVMNCTIRNNRARGIIVKGWNGLIQGNTIDGSTIAGILIAPDLAGGMESDFVHGLVIRDNVITHVGYQEVGPWNFQAGALTVSVDPGGGIGHKNIVIENNQIESENGINMLITNAGDVLVRDNLFSSPMWQSSNRGANFGYNPNALVDLENDNNIVLTNNRIVNPGPAMQTRAHVGVNVQGAQISWSN